MAKVSEEEREDEKAIGDIKRDMERKAKGALSWVMKAKAVIAAVVALAQTFWPLLLVATFFLLVVAVDIGGEAKGNNQVSAAASKSVIQNKTYVDVAPAPDGQDGYYFKINKEIVEEYIKELNKAYKSGVYDNALIEDDEEDSEDSESTQQGESQAETQEEEAETQEDADEAETADEEENTETDESDGADRAEDSDGETHYDEDTLAEWFQTDDRSVWEPYLIKMIRAEIASSYPYLGEYEGEVGSEDALGNKKDREGNYVAQGVVQVQRTGLDVNVDGDMITSSARPLAYIPHEELSSLIQSNSEDALEYYSYDSSTGQIYFATYREASETGEGTSKNLQESGASYKALTSMCSMPFNFTFSLLQMSQNPEWVSKVIDLLIEQSEVVIMIQDQLSVSTTVEIKSQVEMKEKQNYEGYEDKMMTAIYKKAGQNPAQIQIPYDTYDDYDIEVRGQLVGDERENRDLLDIDGVSVIFREGAYIEEGERTRLPLNLKFEGEDEEDIHYIVGDCLIVGWDNFNDEIKPLDDLGNRVINNICDELIEKSVGELEGFDDDTDIEIRQEWLEKEKTINYEFPAPDGTDEEIQSVVKTNTATVYIQKANTWCINFSQSAKVEENTDEDEEATVENTYTQVELVDMNLDYELYSSDDQRESSELEDEAACYKEDIYLSKDRLTRESRMTTSSSAAKISPDGEGKQINYKSFLGLWENDRGEYYEGALFDENSRGKTVEYYLPSPNDNVKSAPSSAITGSSQEDIEELLELLDMHEDTQMHGQLMRYYWYLFTGDTKYQIDTNNLLNLFNTDLVLITGTPTSTSNDLLRRFIRYWEHSDPPPTNADGTCYIIESDGATPAHATVGYGIDIVNGGFYSLFIEKGYPTEIGGEVPIEFVDNLFEIEVTEMENYIREYVNGLNLKEYQIHALVSRAFNAGKTGATSVRNGKNFIEAYNSYWNEERDSLYESKSTNADFNHQFYTKYMCQPNTSESVYMAGLARRREVEWTLFQTGYYSVLNEWFVEYDNLILQKADEIHKYMEDNNYTYCVYGGNSEEECGKYGKSHGLNRTFDGSITGYHNTCCATYVSWVLQKVGYMEDSEHLDGATNLKNFLIDKKGWKVITNPSEFRPRRRILL